MKNYIPLLILIVLIVILVENMYHSRQLVKEHDNKIQKIDSIKASLERILLLSEQERDSLNNSIDSISKTKKVIIEKIKPIIVPIKYDGLSNKQLELEMIKAYNKRKN